MEQPTLKKGDSGAAVKTLQRLLNSHKDLLAEAELLEVDGEFGEGTEEVVKRFQKLRSLKVDGIVGSSTWQKLNDNIFPD